MTEEEDKDIYINKLEDTINYWTDLAIYNAEAKKNAINEIFKINIELKAVYWLLFVGFTPKGINMLSGLDIEKIYNLQKVLKNIGADIY